MKKNVRTVLVIVFLLTPAVLQAQTQAPPPQIKSAAEIMTQPMNVFRRFSGDAKPIYDFYGNETGMRESGGNLPNALWKGGVAFGEQVDDYSQNPRWDISFFNNTHMFISRNKNTYENPYTPTENLSIVVRAYGFDQAPISNATVSVERIMVNSPFGSSELSASDYTVTVTPSSNKTDSQGYAIVKVEPATAWEQGDYMVQIKIVSGSLTERKTWWMRITGGGL